MATKFSGANTRSQAERWYQAAQNVRLLVELQPESLEAAFSVALQPFLARGSRSEMEAFLAKLTPAQHQDPKLVALKFNWYYHYIGDAQAYIDLCEKQGTDLNFSDDDSTMQYVEALLVLGQKEKALTLARPAYEHLKAKVAADPSDDRALSTLSYAQALVGDRAGAVASVEKLLAKLPNLPLRLQFFVRANAAIVSAWLGEKDKAVELMAPLLRLPTAATSSVYALRYDIDFSPLRGYAPWEAMLNDPASSKPFDY